MSFLSLLYITRKSLEQQRSNTYSNITNTRTPTLEHRYEICLSNCGVGQYRSGCSGINPGSCIACTGLPANQYWTSTGGLTNTCGKQSCDSSSCGVGYYLSGCSGTSSGTCEACTGLGTGEHWTSNGGFTDSCSKAQCQVSSCAVGEYLQGCGDDSVSAGTCVSCT